MKFIYLAQPFTHPDPIVRNDRIEAADYATAQILLHETAAVFAPISQGPRVARHLPPKVAANHEFWMRQCIRTLRVCTDLYLLPLDGWRHSQGVEQELLLASLCCIPVTILRIEGFSCEDLTTRDFKHFTGIEARIQCL